MYAYDAFLFVNTYHYFANAFAGAVSSVGLEHHVDNVRVAGSSPAQPTILAFHWLVSMHKFHPGLFIFIFLATGFGIS